MQIPNKLSKIIYVGVSEAENMILFQKHLKNMIFPLKTYFNAYWGFGQYGPVLRGEILKIHKNLRKSIFWHAASDIRSKNDLRQVAGSKKWP